MMGIEYNTENPNDIVVYVNRHFLGNLSKTESGFYQWFPPKTTNGYITSWILKELYEKLDKLNEEWELEVSKLWK